jgi:dTDP-4-dehydrorhamnose reductase
MKILLFGRTGQLSWELCRSLAPLGDVFALDREGRDGLAGDITDEAGLRATVAAVLPDIIVNAAALVDFNRCENEPGYAHLANTVGPKVLAEEAAARGTWLVHYSTDYVFDGSGERRWCEDDRPAPLSVYGKTKLAGDEAILASGCHHLILRISWIHAPRGDNFPRTMLRLAAERERLTVINDQIGAPTGADLVADVTAHLVHSVLTDPVSHPAGLYHLTAAGETSWHAYASFIFDEARRRGMALKVKEVVPIRSVDWSAPGVRPLNSRLDTTRLRTVFGLQLPDWQFGVMRLLDEIRDSVLS